MSAVSDSSNHMLKSLQIFILLWPANWNWNSVLVGVWVSVWAITISFTISITMSSMTSVVASSY